MAQMSQRGASFTAVMLALCLLALTGQENQRDMVLRLMRTSPDGVQIIDEGILGCAVTVGVSKDEQNAGLGLQVAATVAAMKARAEVALYLAGVYSGETVVDKASQVTKGGSIHSAKVSRVIQSAARARFANGERVSFERVDEKTIRVIYAWGLSNIKEEFPDSDSRDVVKNILERTLASNEFPSPDIRVVQLPNSREALLIVVKVIAPTAIPLDVVCAHPIGESIDQSNNGKPCLCVSHRRKVVEIKCDSTVLGWIEKGDVSCEKYLRRASSETIERITEGAKALETVLSSSSKIQTSSASSEFKGILGPEWYQSRITESRVTPEASACAVLVPIPNGSVSSKNSP